MVSFRDILGKKNPDDEEDQPPDGKEIAGSGQVPKEGVTDVHRTETPHLSSLGNEEKRIKEIGFNSDLGIKRSVDEDSIVAFQMISAFEARRRKLTLLILADGMGGHSKGELASRIASLTISTEMQTMLNPIAYEELPSSDADYQNMLSKAIGSANDHILKYSQTYPNSEGMGTTVVIGLIDHDQKLHVANVGDSRLYVVSAAKGAISLTKDHSYVQELVDSGEITMEEARHHPRKNIINRAVGVYAEAKADTSSIKLENDDIVLLCSDGLINHLSDAEIANVVLKNKNSQTACDELVSIANQRGGTDNISVIVAPAGIATLG